MVVYIVPKFVEAGVILKHNYSHQVKNSMTSFILKINMRVNRRLLLYSSLAVATMREEALWKQDCRVHQEEKF